jgi:dihydroorotase
MIDWSDVARIMSRAPAAIGGLKGHGEPIEPGSAAQLVLYDPAATRTFGTEHLAGKGVNSPYLGMRLPGRVVATFHDGRPTVLDGAVLDGTVLETTEVAHG